MSTSDDLVGETPVPRFSFPVWDVDVDLPRVAEPPSWIHRGGVDVAVELRRGQFETGPGVAVWSWHPSIVDRWPVVHALTTAFGDLPTARGGDDGDEEFSAEDKRLRLAAFGHMPARTSKTVTVGGKRVDALTFDPDLPGCWMIRVSLSDGTNVTVAGRRIMTPNLILANPVTWPEILGGEPGAREWH